MPRIPREHLDSVVTLYGRHPKTDARVPIGTAFLVAWTDEFAVPQNVYLVTCIHCKPATAARFSTDEWLSLDLNAWTIDPAGNDVMALDITEILPEGVSDLNFIHLGGHTQPLDRQHSRSNVGDEIYMLGLHVAEDNSGSPRPRARFGNISAWADENMLHRQGNNAQKPSHIGDMRSRGGFSGSPVFTIRESNDWNDSTSPTLFGIHSDQYNDRILIETSDRSFHATIPSSMTIIVPAWTLRFIIDDAHFKADRERRAQHAQRSWQREDE